MEVPLDKKANPLKARILMAGATTCVLALVVAGTSAMAKTHEISRTKHVGPYKLVLKVGPARMVTEDSRAKRGELMMSGKLYRCSMKMKKTAEPYRESMKEAACNHLVELHVYRHNRVVRHAHVWIRLYRIQNHMAAWVPIMRMESAGRSRDLHYGNNVHAMKGMYNVFVAVNGSRAKFSLLHLTGRG